MITLKPRTTNTAQSWNDFNSEWKEPLPWRIVEPAILIVLPPSSYTTCFNPTKVVNARTHFLLTQIPNMLVCLLFTFMLCCWVSFVHGSGGKINVKSMHDLFSSHPLACLLRKCDIWFTNYVQLKQTNGRGGGNSVEVSVVPEYRISRPLKLLNSLSYLWIASRNSIEGFW